MRDACGIVFVGDIHRHWRYVEEGLAALPAPPRAAVLLGDMECDEPLDRLAAPLLRRGVAVHWIFGNHDYDGGPEMWANLSAPQRNPLTAPGALHGRVVEIGGLRVAGLGGVFRRRVWEPPEPPRLQARAELEADLATLEAGWNAAQRRALADALAAMAIWPEDWEALRRQRADILVTHEAPSSHPIGAAALEELARALGARLLVHGHHHVNTLSTAPDGLRVLGVASGWGVAADGAILWPGEAPRWLGAAPAGWRRERVPDRVGGPACP
ncbi:metallophosphoesterase [Roseomonas sp. OT10]|uniref:metallophosphoesterase family protein n=1 Tax=Roseomonas cutis TaxID=2897332 RepID=UPI001E282752|nr:metallophosphoesterase [Roseomonas sp. OT10]UFN48421.1 metallophosphoesterase [Roseomonas sp. OT10]